MTKRNGKRIHTDRLVKSSPDVITLAQEVERGYLELCRLHLQARDAPLPIPASLNPDVLRWRQMRVRHKAGDLRHSEAEYQSVKTIAQWTVDVKAELCGQTPEKLEWRD